ncbi:hypothetical protein D3C78_1587150 [compost metagenome]
MLRQCAIGHATAAEGLFRRYPVARFGEYVDQFAHHGGDLLLLFGFGCLGLLQALYPLDSDALQQHTSGVVVGVL